MDFGIIALVFGVIFIAELPDKSLFAALILGHRYPKLYVWLGAALAFGLHVIIAVAAAKLLVLLPHQVMQAVIAALFFAGAMLVFFGKHGIEDHPPQSHLTGQEAHRFSKVFLTAFSVVFIGEWGDITQIATANYAAKYHDPLSVAIGAVLGLWTVTALAVFAGTRALSLVPPKILQRITGFILLTFAIISLVSAIKG